MQGSKELRRIRKRREKISNALLWATAVEVAVCAAITMLTAVCISGAFGAAMFITCNLCLIWLEAFFITNEAYFIRKANRIKRKIRRRLA